MITLSNYGGEGLASKVSAAEAGSGGRSGDSVDDDSDAGLPSVQSDVNTSTVSLSIGGDDQSIATEAGIGTVAYRRHTVTVELDNVAQYFLRFYGNDKLTPPAGGTEVVGVGTDGVIGRDIQPGTWGYSWDYDGNTDDEEMTYRTVPSSSADLTKPVLVDNAVSFTGKLNFAANFPSNATLGNYTSSATLTLIATPKANTGVVNLWRNAAGEFTAVDAGTDEMQGVDASFCSDEVGEGWTIDLKDNRDQNVYTIYKAADDNCWMGRNLALTGPLILASEDTDLVNGATWELPESTSEFSTESNVVQVKIGDGMPGWRTGWGNYYSWNAATAGTGDGTSSGQANDSICPKGWKLPTYSGVYSFQNLTVVKSDWTTGVDFNGVLNNNGFYLGIAGPDVYKNANFWPAAGYYSEKGFFVANTNGDYWSRSPYGTNNAYRMVFGSDGVHPDNNTSTRHYGFSVRCVHEQAGAWKNNSAGQGEFDSGLRTMQEITKSNFTEKYCVRTQDSVVAVGATMRLRDTRDGKYYTIVKLPDGNCWMQENLALDARTKIYSTDSDITANEYVLPPSTTTGWQTAGSPAQMVNGATNIALNTSNLGDRNGWQSNYGNYYSWATAIAETGKNIATAMDASGSICPKGWKLPTGNTTGQFYNLFGEKGENLANSGQAAIGKVVEVPYKFPAAGFIYSNVTLYGSGTIGRYWSRTSVDRDNAFNLDFEGSSFQSGTRISYHYLGYSVRCVAEPSE